MDVTNPAVDVLLLAAFAGPLAVYFLFLGLVNSHARPYLVSARADFASLAIVASPLLVAPMPTLMQAGLGWLIPLEIALAASGFFLLLPKRRAGWVVYNITPHEYGNIVRAAIDDLGWRGDWSGETWSGPQGRLHLNGFPLLRNVAIHMAFNGRDADEQAALLAERLDARLAAIAQLPSTTGVCLVMLGIGLMALPIWMMGRHMQELVEAVIHLFG
jgi:hypothetical protein